MPPNIKTINMLFGTNITKKEEMVAWLNKRRPSSGKNCFPSFDKTKEIVQGSYYILTPLDFTQLLPNQI